MNIKDLPQGSYKVVSKPTNINQLSSGSYKVVSQPKKPGYLENVWEQYAKAGEDIISGIKSGATQIEKGISQMGQPGISGPLNVIGGLARSGLRTVGGVAGAAFAPITEAPGIKQGLGIIGTGISKIPGVNTIIGELNKISQKYPEASKDIQNIINIAILTSGAKAQKPAGKRLVNVGKKIEQSGIKSADIAKMDFAQKLVSPMETKAVKLSQVGRTTEARGFLKKDIITPTKIEAETAKEVSMIPGISPKSTFQKNFNVIKDFNLIQAKQLKSDIAKYDFVIPKNSVLSKLDEVAKNLKDSPLMVGDAEKTANKLIGGVKKFIESNKNSGSGLLKARKEFDIWVKSQKPKIFDAKAENSFTIANDAIRNTLNTILDENAVNLGIKDSLKKQSLLYRAMSNIGPKAALEANTPLYRALSRIGKILGIKSRLVQGIAAAVGIGGLGAAATFAPPVAILGGIGFITYKAGKLVMNPQVRIALGKLLQESGHLLNPADKKIIEDAIKNYLE